MYMDLMDTHVRRTHAEMDMGLDADIHMDTDVVTDMDTIEMQNAWHRKHCVACHHIRNIATRLHIRATQMHVELRYIARSLPRALRLPPAAIHRTRQPC